MRGKKSEETGAKRMGIRDSEYRAEGTKKYKQEASKETGEERRRYIFFNGCEEVAAGDISSRIKPSS